MSSENKNLNVTMINPQISVIVLISLVILFYNFDGYDIDLYDAIMTGLTF